MPATFRTSISVQFRQADSAGIMFFANVFGLAHDVYEKFIPHLGIEWHQWFEHTDWAVPVRHAEADYLRPLLPNETYEVDVQIERLGKSSFTLKFAFSRNESLYCTVTTAHTFYNKKLRSKMSIPSAIRL